MQPQNRHEARLAAEGQEWQQGRDYEIVGRLGGGEPGGGGRHEGCTSVVFRIRKAQAPRRGEEFALKMVIHLVGEEPHERAGHARSTALVRGLGAEWREPLRLPPHECLVPVLHHYHSDTFKQYVPLVYRQAAADRTLFLVT
eukprot:SAG31_NODE_24353_length_483_cov_1.031250_1_plen_141_part_10